MPITHVAVTTELLAIFAFLTVKNLINICGSPAVPSTSANIRDNVSNGILYLTPGFK